MGEGGDFIAHERQVAMNVRDALRQTPVKQVIFKLAQAPENEQSGPSARPATDGRNAAKRPYPVTELRAGIIVGAQVPPHSEVMRDMVYNLPVLTPPRWVRSRTTPIALENLLHYLVALLDHPAEQHRVLEAAGSEVLSYQAQFESILCG